MDAVKSKTFKKFTVLTKALLFSIFQTNDIFDVTRKRLVAH